MTFKATIEDFRDELNLERLLNTSETSRGLDAKHLYEGFNELMVKYFMYKERYLDVQDNHTNAEGDRTDKTGDTEDLPFH